jgi:uncharacterized phage protein (TIGR01671 family)
MDIPRFRVWVDKGYKAKQKRMFYVADKSGLDKHGMYVELVFCSDMYEGWELRANHDMDAQQCPLADDFGHITSDEDGGKLMQCTFLKDTENRFIWEGDIVGVFYSDMRYEIGVVGWVEGAWVVWVDAFDESNPLHSMYKSCKVIGNICENSSLIETEAK